MVLFLGIGGEIVTHVPETRTNDSSIQVMEFEIRENGLDCLNPGVDVEIFIGRLS
jgi:hypothetical protein